MSNHLPNLDPTFTSSEPTSPDASVDHASQAGGWRALSRTAAGVAVFVGSVLALRHEAPGATVVSVALGGVAVLAHLRANGEQVAADADAMAANQITSNDMADYAHISQSE